MLEFRVPELGEGVYEAEVVQWLVQAGQFVRPGDMLVEVITDKAAMELPAPFAGKVDMLLAEVGQMVEVGQPLVRYTLTDESNPGGESLVMPAHSSAASSLSAQEVVIHEGHRPASGDRSSQHAGNGSRRRRVAAAPAVRKMARALDVDLADVRATGPGGRVLIEDLGTFVRDRGGRETRPPLRSSAVDLGTPGTRIQLRGVRRSIADHMLQSKKTIPHYSYIDECDVSELVSLRNELKRPFYAQGIKLTHLPFYVKAAAVALQKVPLVNASLDQSTGEIVLHDEYHIGVATATARGLMVPVVRHADRKSVAEIAAELEHLIRAAQRGTISRDELRGGTFTVSSVGNIGGLVSTPIIHHPEVAIVAIGKVFQRPVFNEQGQVVPARVTYLSFSFDHRVVDGSVGAIFGNSMIQQLQHPRSLVTDK